MTGPLEGGDVWGSDVPHGASPPSSGHEPEASYQRQAEADFGAGRGSDTKGAGSPDIPRPTNLADICVECGSGLLNGQHIADYPCLRRAEAAERERDQTREALRRIAYPTLIPLSLEAKGSYYDAHVLIAREALGEL